MLYWWQSSVPGREIFQNIYTHFHSNDVWSTSFTSPPGNFNSNRTYTIPCLSKILWKNSNLREFPKRFRTRWNVTGAQSPTLPRKHINSFAHEELRLIKLLNSVQWTSEEINFPCWNVIKWEVEERKFMNCDKIALIAFDSAPYNHQRPSSHDLFAISHGFLLNFLSKFL